MAKNDWMYGLLAALNVYTGAMEGTQRREERDYRRGRDARRDEHTMTMEGIAQQRESRQADNDEVLRELRQKRTDAIGQTRDTDDLLDAAKALIPQARRSNAYGGAVGRSDASQGDLSAAMASLEKEMAALKPEEVQDEIGGLLGTGPDPRLQKASKDRYEQSRQRLQDELSVLQLAHQRRALKGGGAPQMPGQMPGPMGAPMGGPGAPGQPVGQMHDQPPFDGNPAPAATMPTVSGPKVNARPRMPQDPRMQSGIGEQIGRNFPQGPGGLPIDQKMSGEVVYHKRMVDNPLASPQQQMASWFALHDLIGVPIPMQYQQWAQGMGIPKEMVEAMASQLGVGSGMSDGRYGEQPPGSQHPTPGMQQIERQRAEGPEMRRGLGRR